MEMSKLLSATIIAGAALTNTAAAATIDVITGGSATIEFTADFGAAALTTNWDSNEAGNPERTVNINATRVNDDGSIDRSQFIDGGALLSLSRATAYISPVDADGEEVESFASVKAFSFRETDPSITDEMKNINYVATDDPNVFTDYKDPSASYTLTDEQVALLNDSELRLCCTHTLGSLEINTANMTVDGVIDSIAERDINFDGVIDESDEFHFFDLVATEAEGVWGLSLTETLASYLNFGYTEYAFADGQALLDGWAALQPGGAGYLSFAGGDVIGTVSYAYDTGVVVAPVPLPAGMPLLLAGLGAMGFVRRRRNKANA